MPAPHCSVFYRLDALPAAQPTASKHWRHISKTLQHQKYINTVPGKVPCSGTTIQKHSAKWVHEITETSIPSPTETDHDMHHIISSRVAVGQTTWPQILPDSPVLCQLQWFRHVASPADVMYGGEDKESERQNDSFQAPTNNWWRWMTNQMYQPPTTHFTAITQVNLH